MRCCCHYLSRYLTFFAGGGVFKNMPTISQLFERAEYEMTGNQLPGSEVCLKKEAYAPGIFTTQDDQLGFCVK
jgi:hypothetical protein